MCAVSGHAPLGVTKLYVKASREREVRIAVCRREHIVLLTVGRD